MTDNGRRAMSPDPDSRKDMLDSPTVLCEDCNSVIRVGSWPWCRGDFRRHWRDFTDSTAEVWAEASKAAKRPNTV